MPEWEESDDAVAKFLVGLPGAVLPEEAVVIAAGFRARTCLTIMSFHYFLLGGRFSIWRQVFSPKQHSGMPTRVVLHAVEHGCAMCSIMSFSGEVRGICIVPWPGPAPRRPLFEGPREGRS
jgi:hypothetical protein